MLQYRLYGGHSLPAGPQGFLKAAANVGSVIGQFGFGSAPVPYVVGTNTSNKSFN
jgi:PHS family inorganic phosphate transporter-like MFS transporter